MLTIKVTGMSVVFLFVMLAFLLIKTITNVQATACVPPANTYGTATTTVSTPTTGTYNVWVRMQTPVATSNSIMLQLNGNTCYNVGGNASMPINTWTWVNYQNGTTSQVIQPSLTAGNNTFELIGTQQGVKVDNVLVLSDAGCVPIGTGANCTTNQPAPTTPTNVTAKANSPTSVSLGWTASTDTGGPGVAGYYIFRGGTKIATVNSTTSYTDNTVVGATSYSYTIKAYDTSATPSVSPASSAANITTPSLPPSSPTNVTAKANSATSVSVGWAASTDTNGPGLGGYYILRGGTKIGQVSAATTTYTDNTATANTTYSYTVEAFDSANPPAVSSPSTAASVTTPQFPLPTTPTGLTATAGSSTSVSLNWSASSDQGGPGIAGYNVYRNGTLIGGSASTTYTDNTATASTTYSYTVAAFDSATPPNVSLPSTAASVTTPKISPPTTPTNVVAKANSPTSVTVSWAASSDSGGPGVAGYFVLRDGTQISQVSSSTTTYTDTTVAPNSTHTYGVKAFDSATPPNVSLAGTSNSITSPAYPLPVAPSSVTATVNNYQTVSLTWQAGSDPGGPGLAGYFIIRNGITLGQVSSSTTTYTDNTATASTTYTYAIEAFDSATPPEVSLAASANPVTTPNPPDSSPPSQPTNLMATAASSSQINLSWTPSTDNIGVKGYTIYRNGIKLTSVTANSYGDTGLSPSTSYTYYVVAFDAGSNNSLASSTASAVTQPATTTTGTVEGTVIDAKSGRPIAGAYVHTGINGTSNGMVTAYTSSAGQYVLANLATTSSQSFSFSATGYVAKSSSFSVPSGITIFNVSLNTVADTTPPAAPTSVHTTNITSNSVSVSWTASTDNVGVAGYRVWRGDGNWSNWVNVGTVSASTLNFTNTGLTPSTNYPYCVRAYDVAGNISASSNCVYIKTLPPAPDTTPPAAPTNVHTTNITSNSVSVSWTASTDNVGVAGYRVWRGDGNWSNWVNVGTVSASTLNFTNTGLTPNTSYTYGVRAYDAAGNISSSSNTPLVKTTP